MTTFTHPFVILCEGDGDESLLTNLVLTRDLGSFDIHIAKGQKFGELLTAMPIGGDVTRVLIITDSDDDPMGTFVKIQDQVTDAGLSSPSLPLERSPGVPSVTVFLLPWHTEMGNIETLCVRAMRDEYKDAAACLDAYVACCPDVKTWRPGRQSQMQFRTLASSVCQTDPNTPLKYAWKRSDLRINLMHPCFDALADAIRAFGAQ